MEITISVSRKAARAIVIISFGAAFCFATAQAAPVKLWEKAITCQGTFKPFCGATIADLDGDGFDEILAASTDGKCYVWRHNGAAYPGFPKSVHREGIWFHSTPAVGDIDGDGDVEIVIGARGQATDGALYAWHHDGTTVQGFPIDRKYIFGTVALEDLNGDRAYEIIAGERHWPMGTLHVFNGSGRAMPGWTKSLPSSPWGEPAVGDIDGDKKPEVLIGSRTDIGNGGNGALYAWNDDGTPVSGFPFELTSADQNFGNGAPTLADFDNDGRLEIAFGVEGGTSQPSYFYVLRRNGKLAAGWPKEVCGVRGTASAGDIDNDGYLEIIGSEYHAARGGRIFVWNYDGSSVPGFPSGAIGVAGTKAVADVDGDGRLEIVADAYSLPGPGNIVGLNHNGTSAPGFPITTTYATWFDSPAIQDIDDDGKLELAVVTYQPLVASTDGSVAVYRLGGNARSPVWAMHNHDRRHTSCHDTDLGIGIALDYFCARAEGNGILVRWATASEWNHAGFNIYRALTAGGNSKVKINEVLIKGRSPYGFRDGDIEAGEEYEYWLEAVDLNGYKETYGPVRCAAAGARKATFDLAQNRPNPARGVTTVAFSLPAAAEATLTVYDISGRKVGATWTGACAEGDNDVPVDVSALAPGVYTYRLTAGGASAVRKMVVVR